MTNHRVEEILNYAEREIRKNGFDAVSFRNIASAIGIKSASVHYHFPTKADLTAGVTQRYADRFIASLGPQDDPTETANDRIARLSAAYVQAYAQDRSVCLCAVLGAVMTHLPHGTSTEIKSFYDRLIEWITTAMREADGAMAPGLVVSLLQGAMVLSIVTGNEERLLAARDYLIQNV